MEIKHFSFSANFNQKLICGEKSILSLPSIVSDIGNKVLLVTTNSFTLNPLYKEILSNFQRKKIKVFEIINSGEPSVDFVDYVVENYSSENINVVVAIGGGSAIDTAKAISAMLPLKESVMFYLEGVGNKRHPGIKVPFIAIPTTAGTGAEATKNAVISRIGKDGFKKSLRHENFIPDIAILDPTLIKSCPPHVRVASGMDALTQLIEAYVATNSNVLTDALCEKAFNLAGKSFKRYIFNQNPSDDDHYSMLLIAYFSGLALSNSGLGTVHGFASVIGGYYPIPHGIVCAKLIYEVTKKNISKLSEININSNVLDKYAKIGMLISDNFNLSIKEGLESLLSFLLEIKNGYTFPSFKEYGIKKEEFEKIASSTSNKNNPVELTKDELIEILSSC